MEGCSKGCKTEMIGLQNVVRLRISGYGGQAFRIEEFRKGFDKEIASFGTLKLKTNSCGAVAVEP